MEELNQLAARVWKRVASGQAYDTLPVFEAQPKRQSISAARLKRHSASAGKGLLPVLLLLLLIKRSNAGTGGKC